MQEYFASKTKYIKYWFREFSTAKAKRIYRLSRRHVSMIGRFLSGHCFLRRQNKVTKLRNDSTLCRLCEEAIERPLHIIRDCPALFRD